MQNKTLNQYHPTNNIIFANLLIKLAPTALLQPRNVVLQIQIVPVVW